MLKNSLKIPSSAPEADYFQNLIIFSCPQYICGKSFMKIRSVVAKNQTNRKTNRQTPSIA